MELVVQWTSWETMELAGIGGGKGRSLLSS
jgi:hypothetical protein